MLVYLNRFIAVILDSSLQSYIIMILLNKSESSDRIERFFWIEHMPYIWTVLAIATQAGAPDDIYRKDAKLIIPPLGDASRM